MGKERIVFLDWLRAIACLMVITLHSSEPFYLGGDGTYIENFTDAFWVTLMNSPLRACVPLFAIASSYLLFPLKTDTLTFFKRRVVRVFVPFVLWMVVYSIVFPAADGGVWANLKRLPFNIPDCGGHLWFVYMILGIYLLIPLLSPWIEKVSKRGEEMFLLLWALTTLVPFLRELSVSLTGKWSVFGEANWNEFGLLQYVSGYIGYLVLAHYFKKYVPELSWKKTLSVAIPCWLAGYAISAGWFWAFIPKSFPVNQDISLAVHMEVSWRFCTIDTLLTTMAYFLVIRKISFDGAFYRRVILPVSKASYGAYLLHIIVLLKMISIIRPWCLDVFGAVWSTPVCILLTGLSTYVLSCIIAIGLQRIPFFGKYIAG